MHISYGSKNESAENLEVSEGYFPLCFTLFQFIRDNFHAILNQQSLSFDLDNQKGNEILDQDSSALDLQPPNSIEFKIAYEGLEVETYDQMMQDDSVPLCFEEFQFLKENFCKSLKQRMSNL